MRRNISICAISMLAIVICGACSTALADSSKPAAIYKQKCAVCHDHPVGRIPSRSTIKTLPAQQVIYDLTFGVMQPQGLGLSVQEIASLATFLTGKSSTPGPQPKPNANMCSNAGGAISLSDAQWNGWGHDVENSRFQPDPGFTASEISKLKVKWVFAYPGPLVGSQPTVVGGRVFVATTTGLVYSLNAQTGCTYWTFQADSEIRSALSVGTLRRSAGSKIAVFGADLMKANAYAINAATGKLIWKTKVDQHPLARITGSPVFYDNRLYVPTSSQEEGFGAMSNYPCCTARGSVVALNASTGKILWTSYPIEQKPKPFKKTSTGVQMYGPAGASIWSAPTIDATRHLIYVGTGDSFTDVPTKATDAIVAMDIDTGHIKWIFQATKNDNYLFGCNVPGKGICPDPVGPDYDFGSSPVLHTEPDGKQVILAGQKSGIVYELDPNSGKLIWKKQVGPGSMGGGVEWAIAANANSVFVPIANQAASSLSALQISDDATIWHDPAPKGDCSWGKQGCSGTESAAISVISGAVFSGAADGHLRAYSTKDGSVLWDFDTAAKTYQAVNGVPAKGGTLGTEGPTIANGIVYVNSGEGRFNGHRGNALIAFSVDGK
ncbi:MAG TPA: PQQ-binding-like beta-propeller repeat protein [Candidatus Dormibacteraeota bacterium]|nr:PQQ-binding-like beta-propeller repeat protein [Candidatus Dormibacteraeota bacterium]